MNHWLPKTLGRQILGGSAVSIAIRIAGVGLGYVANVLLSRTLGASGYGQYAIALGWCLVLVLPARMGFDYSAIRYGAMYLEADDKSSLRGFVQASIRSVTGLSVLIGVTMVLVASAFAAQIHVLTTAAAAALLPPLALIGVLAVMMRVSGRYAASQFYDQLVRPAALIILLALFWWTGAGLSAAMAALLTATAAWISLAALGWHFRNSFSGLWSAPPSFADLRKWYVLSLPLLGVTVAQEVLNQLEIILLGAMADSRSAGLFAAASRLVGLLTFALAAFGIVSGPMIASAYHKGNFDELQYVTRMTTRLSLIFACGVALMLVVGGKFLLSLFGPEFQEAYVPLMILVAGGLVNAFTGIVVYLATLTGRERPALAIFLSALVISLALNLVLIPRLGIVGAAIASSTALSFWNLAMLIYVRRELGIDASAFGFKRRVSP